MLFICFYPSICFPLSIGSPSLSSMSFSGTCTVREHNWYWLLHHEVCQFMEYFCLRKKEGHQDIIHRFYTHIVHLRTLLVYGQIFIFICWRETGLCMFNNLWLTGFFSAESFKNTHKYESRVKEKENIQICGCEVLDTQDCRRVMGSRLIYCGLKYNPVSTSLWEVARNVLVSWGKYVWDKWNFIALCLPWSKCSHTGSYCSVALECMTPWCATDCMLEVSAVFSASNICMKLKDSSFWDCKNNL